MYYNSHNLCENKRTIQTPKGEAHALIDYFINGKLKRILKIFVNKKLMIAI